MEQISSRLQTKSLYSQKKKSLKRQFQIVADAQILALAFSIMAAAVTGSAGCSRSPVIEIVAVAGMGFRWLGRSQA